VASTTLDEVAWKALLLKDDVAKELAEGRRHDHQTAHQRPLCAAIAKEQGRSRAELPIAPPFGI